MARCKMCEVEGVKLYDYGNMALCLFCWNEKEAYDNTRTRAEWARDYVLMRRGWK